MEMGKNMESFEAMRILRKKTLLTQYELAMKLAMPFETMNKCKYILTIKTKRLTNLLFRKNNIEVDL